MPCGEKSLQGFSFYWNFGYTLTIWISTEKGQKKSAYVQLFLYSNCRETRMKNGNIWEGETSRGEGTQSVVLIQKILAIL